MAIEITGRVVNVLAPVTGQGKNGEWKKQEFVIETQDQFPKKIMFSMWGDKAELASSLQAGEDVKVSFNPESREYNGRWYTDLRAWRIDRGAAAMSTGGNQSSQQQGGGMNQDRDYNFNQERPAPQQQGSYAPPAGGSTMNDDLPF